MLQLSDDAGHHCTARQPPGTGQHPSCMQAYSLHLHQGLTGVSLEHVQACSRMYTADLAPCQVPDMSGTGSAAGYEESWGYSSIARLMSSGEVSIADRTQLDKYGRRIKSAKGPRSTLACNSDNGSGATNGAQALHQQEAMRSTAEIVYRFGLDFALKDVVRSSAAAPTYFPREHPGCWPHITAFKAERLVGTTRAAPRPCHGC